MNDRFFEALTQGDSARRPTAVTPEEQRILDDLLPALSLLDQGAPVNGIDLVPFWKQKLEREGHPRPLVVDAELRDPPARQSFARWRGFACYAAMLFVGLVLGKTASLIWDAPSRHGVAEGSLANVSLPVPHYTEEQQQMMFRVLDRLHRPTAATLQLASAELAGCMNCHDSALRHRFSTDRP